MRKKGPELTVESICALMEEVDGVLHWKADHGGYTRGKVAVWHDPMGYLIVRYMSRDYKAHRLLWALRHGRFPDGYIDHINGVTDDNSASNLRECQSAENQQNRQINKNNASGLPGVSYIARAKRWRAYISVQRRQIHLGLFTTREEAYAAYVEAKPKVHTFHPGVRVIA